MLQQISAEIIFMKTDDPGPVIQKLLEIDYDFEVLRWDWDSGAKPDTTITVTPPKVIRLAGTGLGGSHRRCRPQSDSRGPARSRDRRGAARPR